MNIIDHPDFKVTKVKTYCPECDKETEFHSGLRLNGTEYCPPTYSECQECGYDADEEMGDVNHF